MICVAKSSRGCIFCVATSNRATHLWCSQIGSFNASIIKNQRLIMFDSGMESNVAMENPSYMQVIFFVEMGCFHPTMFDYWKVAHHHIFVQKDADPTDCHHLPISSLPIEPYKVAAEVSKMRHSRRGGSLWGMHGRGNPWQATRWLELCFLECNGCSGHRTHNCCM